MKLKVLWVLVVLSFLTTAAMADTVLVNRPLPISNLNNAAGANRSNVAWADPPNFYGDSFSVAGSGTYTINSITVWTISNGTALGDNYSAFTLYGGADGIGLTSLSTGTFNSGSSTNNNANITVTPVTYSGGSSYQTTSGTFRQLEQVTFSNLGWVVNAGDTYDFGVNADLADPNAYPFFLHASANSALSGNTQDGWNGVLLEFDPSNLSAAPTTYDSNGNGWDKSSDLNYVITGSQVPEPSSLILLGSGLAGLAGTMRRKFRK